MGDAVVGRESVSECIDLLEERYGRFAVNQTTVTVPAEGYERARERAARGRIDAYVRVWNDDSEAIHFRCPDPFAPTEVDQSLAKRVREALRAELGVDATVEAVGRVTIAGIRDEDDPDAPTVFRLFVLFDAKHAGGTPAAATWEAEDGAVPTFVAGPES